MNEQIDINFKPSAIYNIVKFFLYTILIYSILFIINNFFPSITNTIFYEMNYSDLKITFDLWMVGHIFVILLLIKNILKISHIKLFNNYHLTNANIVIRNGLFNNKISLPLNGRLLLESKQNFIQVFINLVDIELEADGDSSAPEAVLKNVSPKYFDLLNELKNNRY
jgi:uncharacterized membrane protein YdbT with pleckstrin-like domain